MTEPTKLQQLTQAAEEANRRQIMLGMMQEPSDPVERAEAHAAYDRARAEWFEAEQELHMLINEQTEASREH